MSQIYEALLKAQKEQSTKKQTAVKDLVTSVLLHPSAVSDQDLRTSAIATAEQSSFSAAKGDEPEIFRQDSWQPDQERLAFMRPEFSRGIEELRRLRSRLLRERSQRLLKTILITGAGPGEGKTFVTANLAVAMSRHPGSRVLVIDADLRRSALHEILGMEAAPGLSTYLSGELGAAAIVRQTPEPQLCVVTAGTYSSTPTELLHSPRMRQLLENMSRTFNWIFIDSPASSVVADSAVLSEVSDAVMLVIAPGTHIACAKKSVEEIGQKMLGVVLNRAEDLAGHYKRYEYTK